MAVVLLFVALVRSPSTPGAEPRGPAGPVLTERADASNTGASGNLKPREGGSLIKDGAVIENALITGQVTIEADDVTLRNVRVESSDFYGVLVTGKHAVIEDTSVVGTPAKTLVGIAAAEGGGFRAARVDVQDSEDGVRLGDDSVLENSYVHELRGSRRAHYDGVTADGFTGWRISGNTIVNDHNQTGAVWIGDPRFGASEGLLEGNYLAGGGWTVYAGPGTGKGLRVVDNAFSTRFNADSGRFGPVTNWVERNNTWSGNTWADGPRKGTRVGSGAP